MCLRGGPAAGRGACRGIAGAALDGGGAKRGLCDCWSLGPEEPAAWPPNVI